MAKHELWALRQMQALPLSIKLRMTQQRIRDWVGEFGTDGVYVSFSGGKDSTVLLHIVRDMYPDVEAVFVNTGLEYPEIQKFVKTFDNVMILRPKMRFDDVIKTYGYPLISKEVSQRLYEFRRNPNSNKKKWAADGDYGKGSRFSLQKWIPMREIKIPISHMCCAVMKKKPVKDFEKQFGKKPILATMADESVQRTTMWLRYGCNALESNRPRSMPMSFWTEQDVLQYIKENNLPIASVYGDIVSRDSDGHEYSSELVQGGKLYTTGCHRTGCIFCAFGCHLEKEPSRFQRLKETHPRQYEYCIGGGEYDQDGIWKPNKQGLGMGHVFDELNKIYGDRFIKY